MEDIASNAVALSVGKDPTKVDPDYFIVLYYILYFETSTSSGSSTYVLRAISSIYSTVALSLFISIYSVFFKAKWFSSSFDRSSLSTCGDCGLENRLLSFPEEATADFGRTCFLLAVGLFPGFPFKGVVTGVDFGLVF